MFSKLLIGLLGLGWYAAFALGAKLFFWDGWYLGDSHAWLVGGMVCFSMLGLFEPVFASFRKLVWDLMKLSLPEFELNRRASKKGATHLACFFLMAGMFGWLGTELGAGPGFRLVLAASMLLALSGIMMLESHGMRVAARRLRKSMAGVLVIASLCLIPVYFLFASTLSTPFMTLRVKAEPQTPVVRIMSGEMTARNSRAVIQPVLVVVTPNAYGLKAEHTLEELFGQATVKYGLVESDSNGIIRIQKGTGVHLPGYIVRYNDIDDEGDIDWVTVEWKPTPTAMIAAQLGLRGHLANLYEEPAVVEPAYY